MKSKGQRAEPRGTPYSEVCKEEMYKLKAINYLLLINYCFQGSVSYMRPDSCCNWQKYECCC